MDYLLKEQGESQGHAQSDSLEGSKWILYIAEFGIEYSIHIGHTPFNLECGCT